MTNDDEEVGGKEPWRPKIINPRSGRLDERTLKMLQIRNIFRLSRSAQTRARGSFNCNCRRSTSWLADRPQPTSDICDIAKCGY
jgi:hypothetical protein